MTYRFVQIAILLGLLVILPGMLNAQSRTCGQSSFQTEKDSLKWTTNQQKISSYINNQKIISRSLESIPLVFHFILEEGVDSFLLKKVHEQIEVLNESFNGQNHDASAVPDYFKKHMSIGEGPLFCLGKRNIDGNEEIGFLHHFITEDNFGDEINIQGKRMVKYSSLGGSDAWDTNKYINIWIAELEFIQALSTFPDHSDPIERGIIIDPDYFGIKNIDSQSYPFHLGKTLVHELGHYFNLQHVWGNEASCEHDDQVEDTPLQSDIYTGCPSFEVESCNSKDMFMNFMNFTDDDCLLLFTNGQMTRIIAAIDLFYPELKNTNNCLIQEANNSLEEITMIFSHENHRIYIESPNPLKEQVVINMFQMDGKRVMERKLWFEMKEEFETFHLPTGIYILFLQSDGNFISQKMFIY